MIRARIAHRPGYTLMEILVATLISIMLLGALYVAFDLALKGTTTGREVVAENELGRAIINRMTIDLSCSLGPLPPKSGGIDTGGGSSTGSTTGSTTTGSTTTGSTTTGSSSTSGSTTSSSSSSTSSDSSGDAAMAVAANVPMQGGVVGTNTQVTVFVARVPTFLTSQGLDADPTAQSAADLRRVSYYISSSGRGLCRQERPWVLADGVGNSTEPDRSTEADDIIAPEVTSLSFEYASGTSWISEWDGTQPGLDGTSTQGPPRAIRIMLTLEVFDSDGNAGQKTIAHVIPIRTAIGTTAPALDTTSDITDSTSSGSTTTPTTPAAPEAPAAPAAPAAPPAPAAPAGGR